MINTNENYIVALGAQASNPDLRDYRIATTSLENIFPEEFELMMPPVKNQGSVGSCVAHSIALVAEYYNKNQYNLDTELSVGYIYGNRVFPLNEGQGMITRYAIANFCADGTPFLSDFPLHCEVPEIIEAVAEKKSELHDKASKFRFTAYVSTKQEQEMKTALLNGNPIIFTVNWYEDMSVKDGKFHSSFETSTGSHAMVIYGWNKDGWLVQNSWGVFWGNNGKAIWPYKYPINEAFAIIDTDNTQLDIEKPWSAKTKFGKWCVRICNKIYALFYTINYKIKR